MMTIVGGQGIRVAQFGEDVSVSSGSLPRTFKGSWWCRRLSNDEVRVGVGFLNGFEPFLNNRRLSGRNEKNQDDSGGLPVLRLSAKLYDKRGMSRIALAVKVNSEGKLPVTPGPQDIYITQHPTGRSRADQFVGMMALALLVRRIPDDETDFGQLSQIAYFDLSHMVRRWGGLRGRFQHFFAPAA